MTYNGWDNYETWCVTLWLSNEQTHYDKAILCEDERQLRKVAEDIAYAEMNENGLVHDLVNCALNEVNWTQILESFQEDQEEIK